jgi:hypothetical protein
MGEIDLQCGNAFSVERFPDGRIMENSPFHNLTGCAPVGREFYEDWFAGFAQLGKGG